LQAVLFLFSNNRWRWRISEFGLGQKHERAHQMHSKNLKVMVWVGVFVLCLSTAAWSKNPMLPKTGKKKAASESTETISLPANLNAADIDRIMAGLSDEQVRRLLLNELKAQAQREAQQTGAGAKPGGIAGFIDKIKNLTALLQTRIELLRSGGGGPQDRGERHSEYRCRVGRRPADRMAVCALHRGGAAPHHINSAVGMAR
jgi:hypothetical protein